MQLTRFIRLLEITRSQPQTGYALSEIRKEELSDLAQHHYLVTAIAWRLARAVLSAGGQLNLARVLEFALIHDLGELFGGDISMPYGKANPKARTAAKSFEALNLEFLTQFFDEDQQYVAQLTGEILDARSDEALVAKVADYMEVTHYKLYLRRLTPNDIEMASQMIERTLVLLQDRVTSATLASIAKTWKQEIQNPTVELFEDAKVAHTATVNA